MSRFGHNGYFYNKACGMLSQVVAKNKVMVSILVMVLVEKFAKKNFFALRDMIRKSTYNTTSAPRRSGPSPRAERANSRAAALRNAPR